MNSLITKSKSELVIPATVNFTTLVKNSNTTSSLNIQSRMVDLLNEEFTEPQQQWYVANLWMYMNYHPTNDYPINLETVYKMIGFANKGNSMKTLENNFTEDEDYKIFFPNKVGEECLLVRTEKQTNRGGHNREDVMLNTDTFKSLCMLAKTPQGKEMRKYYVKLENINNKFISEQLKEQKQLLIEQAKYSKEKEQIWKNSFRNKCIFNNWMKD